MLLLAALLLIKIRMSYKVVLYKIGDRVRVIALAAETGRVISGQPSPELNTLGAKDPLFYNFRGYVAKLDSSETHGVRGMQLEPE